MHAARWADRPGIGLRATMRATIAPEMYSACYPAQASLLSPHRTPVGRFVHAARSAVPFWSFLTSPKLCRTPACNRPAGIAGAPHAAQFPVPAHPDGLRGPTGQPAGAHCRHVVS